MDSLKKACIGCGINKEISHFYQKNSTKNEIKYDPYCKECRKLAKRNAYKQEKNASKGLIKGPPETLAVIEPAPAMENLPAPSTENAKKPPKKSTDYSIWERAYGRVLPESERFEIKRNLIDLFDLLTEIEQGGKAI